LFSIVLKYNTIVKNKCQVFFENLSKKYFGIRVDK